MNYYEILQVEKNATQDEIKKSYRRLAKEYHPDKIGGDATRFKQIAEAYEHLGDSSKRAAYDSKLYFTANSPFEDFMRNFAGDFSNMFNNSWNANAKGADVRLSINLSVEDVYHGVSKYIDIGNGGFNLEIPKGIKNGAKLKVSGKGQPHPVNSAAPRGDLLITINVLPSDKLIVNGDDIWTDYYLPFYDLILGAEIHIKTVVNSIKLKVPENSFDGKVLRVAGKGMPIMNTGNYGNMMVKLRATYNTLNEAQLKLIKKIKLAENV